MLGVVAGVGACAITARTCPPESQLSTKDPPTGRVESCALTTNSVAALPEPGRDYSTMLGMAHPATLSRLVGPYTHWYPNGAVESAGNYVADGTASVPDGVWGVWYPDGKRKSVGRYVRGHPVGCFAKWDEQGVQLTGVPDGDHFTVKPCEPPSDDDGLTEAEQRSHARDGRSLWGDAALDTVFQGGTFGARNPTQVRADPSARATVQVQVRKYLGDFRVGGALEYRISNSDDAHAYAGSAVVAYRLPLRSERFGAEVQAQLGLQDLALTARRVDTFPIGDVSIWAPIAAARLGVSYEIIPSFAIVAGARVDGATTYKTTQQVEYCAGICEAPIPETWKIGGAAYGVDVGLELRLR